MTDDDLNRLISVSLGERLSDAKYRRKPVSAQRLSFAAHLRVGLPASGTTLAMSDDAKSSAFLFQHTSRYAAGVGAMIGWMNVFTADGKPWHQSDRGSNQGHW